MTPTYTDDHLSVYLGDCRDVLRELSAESVHCIVTSPPYYGLRDYGIPASVWGGEDHEHEWATTSRSMDYRVQGEGGENFHGGTAGQRPPSTVTTGFCPCGAWLGVLGLEPTPDLFVAHMVEVFRELRRVLRRDGTCWMNLGDSYAGGVSHTSDGLAALGDRYRGGGHKDAAAPRPERAPGLKPKDRMMMPARVAIALQADGWWLRDEIVWAKPNPMPSSVTDRTTPAHEMVYLLTKSARYWYDAEAVREPLTSTPEEYLRAGASVRENHAFGAVNGAPLGPSSFASVPSGRNKRSVWTVATQPYPEAHFATFPEALIEPMILAGCPEKVCPECGAGWERQTSVEYRSSTYGNSIRPDVPDSNDQKAAGEQMGTFAYAERKLKNVTTLGWSPSCAHDAPPVPGVVLDPFGGSGTVAVVAQRHGRRATLIDLSDEYLGQMLKRIGRARAEGEGPAVDMPVPFAEDGLWGDVA